MARRKNLKDNMKVVLWIIIAALIIYVLINPGAIKFPESEVCCKSYGLGAYMTEVNIEYEWTTSDECTVPAGFVGGGKTVVGDTFC